MYQYAQLTHEIGDIVSALRQAKRELHPDWITQEVMNNHPDVDGADADFYLCVSKIEVRAAARKAVNAFRLQAQPERDQQEQMTLEGFDHLQEYYVCNRDGTQVGVLTKSAPDELLLAKADELHAMGMGCFQHEDEIRRYVAARRAQRNEGAANQ